MSTLSYRLQELLNFLEERGLPPPTRKILVTEILDGALTDGAGRLRVKRRDLSPPESFERRFEELLGAQRRWVNLSCVGVDGDSLIVTIESGAPGGTTGTTSVNYSGPTAGTIQSGWRVSQSLLIE